MRCCAGAEVWLAGANLLANPTHGASPPVGADSSAILFADKVRSYTPHSCPSSPRTRGPNDFVFLCRFCVFGKFLKRLCAFRRANNPEGVIRRLRAGQRRITANAVMRPTGELERGFSRMNPLLQDDAERLAPTGTGPLRRGDRRTGAPLAASRPQDTDHTVRRKFPTNQELFHRPLGRFVQIRYMTAGHVPSAVAPFRNFFLTERSTAPKRLRQKNVL